MVQKVFSAGSTRGIMEPKNALADALAEQRATAIMLREQQKLRLAEERETWRAIGVTLLTGMVTSPNVVKILEKQRQQMEWSIPLRFRYLEVVPSFQAWIDEIEEGLEQTRAEQGERPEFTE